MVLALVATTSLLALGALTVTTVRAELLAAGQGRSSQQALYVAESGVHAGVDFLRTHCETVDLFTQWMSPGNQAPQQPSGVVGNNAAPGTPANPFGADDTSSWYSVEILNNAGDPGLDAGTDTDGIVVIRSTGHGPGQTVAKVTVTVQNDTCLAAFCAKQYAQRDVGERNTSSVACSQRITSGALRTVNP